MDETSASVARSLVDNAKTRLELIWAAPVTVRTVLVDLPDRAVFRTRTPEGMPVYVKVDRAAARSAREAGVLDMLAHAGVPVPAIVVAIPGSPAILVLKSVAAKALTDADPRSAWIRAGHVLRHLHRLPAPADARPFLGVDTSLPEFLCELVSIETSRARDAGIIPDLQANRFANLLTRRLVQVGDLDPWCLLHGDLKPDHILLDPTRTAVVSVLDFGDVSVGDPIWDLAVLTAHHPERLAEVIVGYQPDPALRVRTTQMIGAYWMLRHLRAANWLHTNGFDPLPELARLAMKSRRAALLGLDLGRPMIGRSG